MIPLMVQEGYRAKGWLGLLLSTRLWYPFYGCEDDDDAASADSPVELPEEQSSHLAAGAPSKAAALCSCTAVSGATPDQVAATQSPRPTTESSATTQGNNWAVLRNYYVANNRNSNSFRV